MNITLSFVDKKGKQIKLLISANICGHGRNAKVMSEFLYRHIDFNDLSNVMYQAGITIHVIRD